MNKFYVARKEILSRISGSYYKKEQQKRKAGFMSSGPRLYLRVHIGGIIIEDFSDFVLQHCS